jgi:alkylation response protein AidB-like acyl-CoA dehydrogenase
MNGAADRNFSMRLAQRGWVGMTLPGRYGGHDRSSVDRFIVTEELLRWGAPVGHHWVADRQSGPIIHRFGSEEQRRQFLPAICRGELGFSIGMSEPDAGSDLAAVITRATQAPGGWLVNGTKIWTTGAQRNDWLILLCRTDPAAERHQGLSQMLVDLRSDGLTVNPIPFIDGTVDFNEVVLQDVFVPDDLVLGTLGKGWEQCTSELALERGGPDRWLSTFAVLEHCIREHPIGGDETAAVLGVAVAGYWGLRQLSLSVARSIDQGRSPVAEAALVKEMGTRFEQEVLAAVEALVGIEPSPDSPSVFEQLLAEAILTSPSFTIRGGTSEILRSVVAKALSR